MYMFAMTSKTTTIFLVLCFTSLHKNLTAHTTEEPLEIEEPYPGRPYRFLYYWYYMMTEEPPEMEENEPYGTGGVTEAPWRAIGATPTEEPPDEYYYAQAVTPVETMGIMETEEPPEENAPVLNRTQGTGLTKTEEPPEVENEATESTNYANSPREDPDVDFEEQTTPSPTVTESVTKARRIAAANNPVIKTRPSENVTEKGLLSAILGVSENEAVPSVRNTAVDQPRASASSTSKI